MAGLVSVSRYESVAMGLNRTSTAAATHPCMPASETRKSLSIAGILSPPPRHVLADSQRKVSGDACSILLRIGASNESTLLPFGSIGLKPVGRSIVNRLIRTEACVRSMT